VRARHGRRVPALRKGRVPGTTCVLTGCRGADRGQNCTMKPPPAPALRARHRRICRTCHKSPLPLLMATTVERKASSGSSPSPPSSPTSRPVFCGSDVPRAFTAPAFERTPCNCREVVWLCAPCGKDLKNADTTYVLGWSWRTRYSHYLGGVGTGAGEGEQGVEVRHTETRHEEALTAFSVRAGSSLSRRTRCRARDLRGRDARSTRCSGPKSQYSRITRKVARDQLPCPGDGRHRWGAEGQAQEVHQSW
jgi:hypothetical protein